MVHNRKYNLKDFISFSLEMKLLQRFLSCALCTFTLNIYYFMCSKSRKLLKALKLIWFNHL